MLDRCDACACRFGLVESEALPKMVERIEYSRLAASDGGKVKEVAGSYEVNMGSD